MLLQAREFEKRSENVLKELKADVEILCYDMLVTLKSDEKYYGRLFERWKY